MLFRLSSRVFETSCDCYRVYVFAEITYTTLKRYVRVNKLLTVTCVHLTAVWQGHIWLTVCGLTVFHPRTHSFRPSSDGHETHKYYVLTQINAKIVEKIFGRKCNRKKFCFWHETEKKSWVLTFNEGARTFRSAWYDVLMVCVCTMLPVCQNQNPQIWVSFNKGFFS